MRPDEAYQVRTLSQGGLHETLGVGMLRAPNHLLGVAGFDDLAVLHDVDAVSERVTTVRSWLMST